MIIEEYGFWDMCTAKDQMMIVKELFSDILEEMEPILNGCEQNFISNFIVSFSYRTYLAGEVVQRGDQETFEIGIVWDGNIVCVEQTEFGEPILVYMKGAIINLYQIMMDTALPFDYRAIGEDEFSWLINNTIRMDKEYNIRKDRITFNEHKFKPWDFPKTSKTI